MTSHVMRVIESHDQLLSYFVIMMCFDFPTAMHLNDVTFVRLRYYERCCKIAYPCWTQLKFNSGWITIVWNICPDRQIVLKNGTAVLGAIFKNYLTTEILISDERDFSRFEIEISFGRIYNTTRAPWSAVQHSISVRNLSWNLAKSRPSITSVPIVQFRPKQDSTVLVL